MPGGRPKTYSKPVFIKVLDDYVTQYKRSINTICDKNDSYPDVATFFRWLAKDNELCEMYARARAVRLERWLEDGNDIASDESRDYVIDERGIRRSDNTAVNRDRLRIDWIKWQACKYNPGKYGDKLTTEHTGKDGGPIQYETTIDRPVTETYDTWLKRVQGEIGAKKEAVH